MNILKKILSSVIMAMLCIALFACSSTTLPPPDGGGGGDKPDVPPVAGAIRDQLVDYVETTMLYDIAVNENVKVSALNLTYTAYKDGGDVYGKIDYPDTTTPYYTKGINVVLINEESDGTTSYELGKKDFFMIRQLEHLAYTFIEDSYEGSVGDALMTGKRTESFEVTADKTKKLTFEYVYYGSYGKSVFTFSEADKLTKIELFSAGEGKIQEVNFAYGAPALVTDAEVKKVVTSSDAIELGLLFERNVSKFRARGKVSSQDNYQINTVNDLYLPESAGSDAFTVASKTHKKFIKNGDKSLAIHELMKEGEGVLNLEKTVYSDSKEIYFSIRDENKEISNPTYTSSVMPYSLYDNYSREYSNEGNVIDFMSKLLYAEPKEVTKSVKDGKTEYNYIAQYETAKDTFKFVFDSIGRLVMYESVGDYLALGTLNKKIYNITIDYSEVNVEKPAVFADCVPSILDKIRTKLIDGVTASGGKNLDTIGGIKIVSNSDVDIENSYNIEISYNIDEVATGKVTNSTTSELRAYIYGGYIVDATLSDTTLENLYYSCFDFVPSKYNVTGFELVGNTMMAIYGKDNKIETRIKFDSNNRITKCKKGDVTLEYTYEKVDKIIVPQNVIDFIKSAM